MNILPKKRWHVRTKDNIARVRKDEAAAREESRKKDEKLQFAESEARINFLRHRSGLPEQSRQAVAQKLPEDNTEEKSLEHVNLFSDYKSHVKTTNKELEKEKKEEQEKYEKQIGYLTYLGQDTNEALRLKSWYEVTPRRLEVGEDREIVEKDLNNKRNHDPLTLIQALLPPNTKIELKHSTKRKQSPSPPPTKNQKNNFADCKRMKNKKEKKKHKKQKHKKHKKSSKTKDCHEDLLEKRMKLEKLRKERLRREATEKARQEALLAPKESKTLVESALDAPRVVQKYNSQFNPGLAKQNMN